MKRKLTGLICLLCSAFMVAGCTELEELESQAESTEGSALTSTEATTEESAIAATEPETEAVTEVQTAATDEEATEEELTASVEMDGTYTTPEDVAEYIYIYGTLPSNFITKNEAKDLGWVSSEGNLWDVAPGMSIGGDYFGNYEGLLPEGDYHECDVNYEGGYRGSERLIYSEDGSIYYTSDHYESFTQLY